MYTYFFMERGFKLLLCDNGLLCFSTSIKFRMRSAMRSMLVKAREPGSERNSLHSRGSIVDFSEDARYSMLRVA